MDYTGAINKLSLKHQKFIEYYIDPKSPTFCEMRNSYDKAGFKGSYNSSATEVFKKAPVQLAIKEETQKMNLNELTVDTVKDAFITHFASDNEAIAASSKGKFFDIWMKLIDLKAKYGMNEEIDYSKMSNEEIITSLKAQREEIDQAIDMFSKDMIKSP